MVLHVQPAWIGPVLVALLVAVMPPASGGPSAASPDLRIAELLSDPGEGPEFIELWNAGTSDVDLHGWTVSDLAGTSYTFSQTWIIGPNARVVLWSGSGATDSAAGPAWRQGTVWNNGGDAASLTNPQGEQIDWLGYGTGRRDPPDGFQGRGYPAAPEEGQSVAWHDDHWEHGDPTPGAAPGASGHATLGVLNAQPLVRFVSPPEGYTPDRPVSLQFLVEDGNGPDDLHAWRLMDLQGVRGEGKTVGLHQLDLDPPAGGDWRLELMAEDRAGAKTTEVLVLVPDLGLRVLLPEGLPIAMPALEPGARNTTTLDPFGIENRGRVPLVPLIDISEFRMGPARVVTLDNLWIGLRDATAPKDHPIRWHPYDRQLTALPPLQPGTAVDVWLRLDSIPHGLPAGEYATSFSVVT